MAQPEVSIIIPVFSEVDSVTQTVGQVVASFADVPIEIIIIAHPRSAPESLDNCRRLAETFDCVQFQLQTLLPGQGLAYRQAIDLSHGRFILFMNADLETHPPDARPLYDAIVKGGEDIVIASRWCPGANFDSVSYGKIKIVLNFLFQRMFALLFGTPITDLTFCYKIARAELFKGVEWKGTQHEFSLETTLLPIVLGLRVREIPTTWRARREGKSNFSFWACRRHFRLALQIAFYTLTGRIRTVYPYHPQAGL